MRPPSFLFFKLVSSTLEPFYCFHLVYASFRNVMAKNNKTLTPTRKGIFCWPQWTGYSKRGLRVCCDISVHFPSGASPQQELQIKKYNFPCRNWNWHCILINLRVCRHHDTQLDFDTFFLPNSRWYCYTTIFILRDKTWFRILWNYAVFWLKQPYSQPATDCSMMEGKLSIGSFNPCATSFNDNAIVRNFYPEKFFAFFEAFQRIAANLKEICIWSPFTRTALDL